jgi:hypothetical protein
MQRAETQLRLRLDAGDAHDANVVLCDRVIEERRLAMPASPRSTRTPLIPSCARPTTSSIARISSVLPSRSTVATKRTLGRDDPTLDRHCSASAIAPAEADVIPSIGFG